MFSAKFSRIQNYFTIENYPQLETLILDCDVSSINIKNCPNLKVILIKEVDNTWHEYYKNGNIKKHTTKGRICFSFQMMRLTIVESDS